MLKSPCELSPKAPYVCPIQGCSVMSRDDKALINHVECDHPLRRAVFCLMCGQGLQTMAQVWAHTRLCTAEPCAKFCPSCGHSCDPSSLESHIQNDCIIRLLDDPTHDGVSARQKKPSFGYDASADHSSHEPVFKKRCLSSSSSSSWTTSPKSANPPLFLAHLKCPSCGISQASLTDLLLHITDKCLTMKGHDICRAGKNHWRPDYRQCRICGNRFDKVVAVNSHFSFCKANPSGNFFCCRTCGFTTRNGEQILEHFVERMNFKKEAGAFIPGAFIPEAYCYICQRCIKGGSFRHVVMSHTLSCVTRTFAKACLDRRLYLPDTKPVAVRPSCSRVHARDDPRGPAAEPPLLRKSRPRPDPSRVSITKPSEMSVSYASLATSQPLFFSEGAKGIDRIICYTKTTNIPLRCLRTFVRVLLKAARSRCTNFQDPFVQRFESFVAKKLSSAIFGRDLDESAPAKKAGPEVMPSLVMASIFLGRPALLWTVDF